jgi:hypothetical protein
MNPEKMEALQMALLHELNDVDGVRGVASETTPEGEPLLIIYVTGSDCEEAITERLAEFKELPAWKLDWK